MIEFFGKLFEAGQPYFGVWFIITIILLASSIISLFTSLIIYWKWKDELIDWTMAIHKMRKK